MISVITPVHPASLRYLAQAYASLQSQTLAQWEWVVLANGGTSAADVHCALGAADSRVRVREDAALSGIGALKRRCCELATGDVLVELDADDLLVPHALERVAAAFADPAAMFAYSNNAGFEDGTWAPRWFDPTCGWSQRTLWVDTPWGARRLVEHRAWPATPASLRSVLWAPDHVRAWRRAFYDRLGGHDPSIRTGDDHELLCRTYLEAGQAGMRHLDQCLYLYRWHAANSSQVDNPAVHEQVGRSYSRYIEPMVMRWARDEGLRLLDLGGRFACPAGYDSVDRLDADVVCDLARPWPIKTGSVGALRAHHIFEHLPDPVHAMSEAWRVLAPGGWLFLEVPSTDGRGAWQDPTHRSFWNINSLWYYTRSSHARYIRPEWIGAFVAAHAEEVDWGEQVRVVRAHLIAAKPPLVVPGKLDVYPTG